MGTHIINCGPTKTPLVKCFQNALDQGPIPKKLDLINYGHHDSRKFDELCVLLFLEEEPKQCSQNPDLVNQVSAATDLDWPTCEERLQ